MGRYQNFEGIYGTLDISSKECMGHSLIDWYYNLKETTLMSFEMRQLSTRKKEDCDYISWRNEEMKKY